MLPYTNVRLLAGVLDKPHRGAASRWLLAIAFVAAPGTANLTLCERLTALFKRVAALEWKMRSCVATAEDEICSYAEVTILY